MITIHLSQPIMLDNGIEVRRIVVHSPTDRCLKNMKQVRKFAVHFTAAQVIWYACRMTEFGEIFLRKLRGADFDKLANAVDRLFQASVRTPRIKCRAPVLKGSVHAC